MNKRKRERERVVSSYNTMQLSDFIICLWITCKLSKWFTGNQYVQKNNTELSIIQYMGGTPAEKKSFVKQTKFLCITILNHILINIPEFTRPFSTPFFSSDNLKVGFAKSTWNSDSKNSFVHEQKQFFTEINVLSTTLISCL